MKMASHPLTEMRVSSAREIETVARVKAPTLLRHTGADAVSGRVGGPRGGGGGGRRGEARRKARPTGRRGSVRLVRYEPDGEDAVLAAILFRAAGVSHREARAAVDGFDTQTKRALLDASVRGIGGHEAPVREFESAGYTFEIVVDFGAYRDIQRHRMTSQTRQLLGTGLGYAIPDDARAAGVADRMERALAEAARAVPGTGGGRPGARPVRRAARVQPALSHLDGLPRGVPVRAPALEARRARVLPPRGPGGEAGDRAGAPAPRRAHSGGRHGWTTGSLEERADEPRSPDAPTRAEA